MRFRSDSLTCQEIRHMILMKRKPNNFAQWKIPTNLILSICSSSSSSIFNVNIITPTSRGDILRQIVSSVYITWVKCLADKMCLQARLKNCKGARWTKVVRQCIPKLRGSSYHPCSPCNALGPAVQGGPAVQSDLTRVPAALGHFGFNMGSKIWMYKST